MSRPSSYDLLIEVTKSQNRLEDKMDKRFNSLENRVELNETKLDQMMGKVGIGVMVVSIGITAAFSFIFDAIRKAIWKQ